MGRAKTKAASTNLPVPQSDDEAEQLIARLGALQTDHEAVKAQRDAEIGVHAARIAALNEVFGISERVFREVETVIVKALNVWATANRDRLTQGGRTKTVQLPTGTISWKEGAPSLTLDGKRVSRNGDEVVALIEARLVELQGAMEIATRAERAGLVTESEGLQAFLREKTTLNKEAMHAAKPLALSLAGVGFTGPGEEFAVEPLASQIREVA